MALLLPKRLLWIDGLGGLIVGVLVLGLHPWLSDWYGMPKEVLLFTGIANLAYGSYSTSLASRSARGEGWIHFLAAANAAWTFVCAALLQRYGPAATWLGVLHIGGEGLYVGALGLLEWRWRKFLTTT